MRSTVVIDPETIEWSAGPEDLVTYMALLRCRVKKTVSFSL